MASITIRRLEDAVKERLRVRASRHSRSMEEEAREILKVALADKGGSGGNLAQSIRRRFAPLGGVELSLPPREPVREPPSWTNDPFGYAAWAKKAGSKNPSQLMPGGLLEVVRLLRDSRAFGVA